MKRRNAVPTDHDKGYVERAIEGAWVKFRENDWKLLEKDANERSITHKFAIHLEEYFHDWDVDCEYNRDEYETKRLHLKPKSVSSDDDLGETVYPDIVVHERGTKNNFLIIEAKKDTNPESEGKCDKRKISNYQKELGYRFGIFIRFHVAVRYKDRPDVEWSEESWSSLGPCFED